MKKKHTGPQIVAKLRQADVLIGQGKSVPEVQCPSSSSSFWSAQAKVMIDKLFQFEIIISSTK